MTEQEFIEARRRVDRAALLQKQIGELSRSLTIFEATQKLGAFSITGQYSHSKIDFGDDVPVDVHCAIATVFRNWLRDLKVELETL